MKRAVLATFIVGAFFASGAASAEQLKHTVLGGYAQSNVKADGENLKDDSTGFNVKYRYELNENLGVVSSFTYTGASYNYYFGGYKIGNVDLDYYSISAGPSYRFNDYVSAYGLLGIAHGRVEANALGFSDSESKTSATYGVGLQFNPVPNWAIDTSYEYSKLGDVKVGTWMVGIGYRF